MPTPPTLPSPPVISPDNTPKPVHLQDLAVEMVDGRATYREQNGTLAEGFYRVFCERSARTADIVNTYTLLTKTGRFRQGLMDGEWAVRYEVATEDLDYTETYRAGLLTHLTVLNPDNTVRYQQDFAQGQGVWKSFYAESKTPRLVGLYRNGREDGTWTYYEVDGRVKELWVYEQGTLRSKQAPR